jgi:hypothetical protein
MLDSSSATRSAITRFSLQVWTNSRYFCRFSKNRKLPRGSRFSGGHFEPARRRHPARHRGRDIGLDAVQRVDGDALALAQPVHQLAVVDGAAAERRFRHVGLAAEFGDLAQDLVVFHRGFGPDWWAAAIARLSYQSAHIGNAGPTLGEVSAHRVRDTMRLWLREMRKLLPPHLVRDIDRELQLGPLLFLGEDVALLGRGKAALRRHRELLQRREFAASSAAA